MPQNINADEAKAMLGLGNRFLEQLMPKQMPEEDMIEMGEEVPQESMEEPMMENSMQNTENPTQEENVDEKYESWMVETSSMMDEKLESFKEELLKAIKKE